jgi:hypothetical protein
VVRKTREQVWRELDTIGEEEVRRRLAAHPGEADDVGLVREWLTQKERVAAELAATREGAEGRGTRRVSRVSKVVGVALLSAAGLALGLLRARRQRSPR